LEREKNAFRKQRDVELERVKSLDEEEHSVEVRESMMHMKSEHNACAKMRLKRLKPATSRLLSAEN
jgi:hypothetical protein